MNAAGLDVSAQGRTVACPICLAVAGKNCVGEQGWCHVGRLKAAGVDVWWLRALDRILAAVREHGAAEATRRIDEVLAGVR